jgi:hypothetical protein
MRKAVVAETIEGTDKKNNISRDLYKNKSDINLSTSDSHARLPLWRGYSIKFENIQNEKIIKVDVKTIFAAL